MQSGGKANRKKSRFNTPYSIATIFISNLKFPLPVSKTPFIELLSPIPYYYQIKRSNNELSIHNKARHRRCSKTDLKHQDNEIEDCNGNQFKKEKEWHPIPSVGTGDTMSFTPK